MRRLWRWLTGAALREAHAERMVRDFQQAFPGRCPVCSYARYGAMFGFEPSPGVVPPHWCPERPEPPYPELRQ